MTGRAPYDEFSLFHENAAEFDLPFSAPPIVRRERVEVAGRALSALVWGVGQPELVLLHGGAELLRRNPRARVERRDAGHSVQGDRPVELAAFLDDFITE